MSKLAVVTALWLSVLYTGGNAAFALTNPQGWLQERSTAKHGYADWNGSDIRVLGVLFAVVGILWAFLAAKFTRKLLG